MAKVTRQPSYVLPHNPMTAAGVLAELKRLKGDKSWLELELELLSGQYPDNTTFKAALAQYRVKAAATPLGTATTTTDKADKETKATDATTASTEDNSTTTTPAATKPVTKGKATKKGTKGQGNGK